MEVHSVRVYIETDLTVKNSSRLILNSGAFQGGPVQSVRRSTAIYPITRKEEWIMKTRSINNLVKVIIASAGIIMASTVFAAQAAPPNTTAQDVEKKVTDAVAAIKTYAIDQRDEALQKAKIVLDDIDARINDLESRLSQKWDQMDQAARQQAASNLAALRKDRNKVAEWYGGLKHGSRQAWEDVKTGFSKSSQDLQDAFKKAYDDFWSKESVSPFEISGIFQNSRRVDRPNIFQGLGSVTI